MALTCYLCSGVLPSWLNVGSFGAGSTPMRNLFCPTCGLIQQSPIPKEESYIFEQNISAQELRAKQEGMAAEAQKLLKKRQSMMGETMEQLIRPGMKIADLGCGYGSFIAYLRDQKSVSVLGVELNPQQAQFAQSAFGLPIVPSTIEEWIDRDVEQFDLIILSHVVEHLRDPITVLQRLQKRLTPGGKMVIEVPNVAVPTRSLHWFFKPEHFWNFTHPTFRALLAKAGMRIEVFQTPAEHSKILAVCRYDAVTPVLPSSVYVLKLLCRMQWLRVKSFLRRSLER